MTLFGWDASDFDWARGPMSLVAAKADGLTWFTHKATESTNVKHGHLADALDRALGAGFEFVGAYHVVRSSPSVNAQVAYFLAYLDKVVPWWRAFPGFMLQVDLELWSYDQVSAATGIEFASVLQAVQPKRVLTYASRGQYGNSLAGIATPLWNANYGTNPAGHYRELYPGDRGAGWLPYSGQAPVMWQYSSLATIGSQPGCDANAYRGTLEDLRQLITGSSNGEDDNMSAEAEIYAYNASAIAFAMAAGADTADCKYAWTGDGHTIGDPFKQSLTAFWKRVNASGGGGTGGGLTKDDVAAAVRSELDATKLGKLSG